MNKIFKVIWNNAKHCYVVASELAKSYSKGGGSRSIRRAMVTLGVAVAVYTAAGCALANSGGTEVNGDYIGNSDSNYNVTIDSNVSGYVYGHRETSANVEEASVRMTGGTVKNVFGGYSYSGATISNSVNISGGTIGYTNSADVYRVAGSITITSDITIIRIPAINIIIYRSATDIDRIAGNITGIGRFFMIPAIYISIYSSAADIYRVSI